MLLLVSVFFLRLFGAVIVFVLPLKTALVVNGAAKTGPASTSILEKASSAVLLEAIPGAPQPGPKRVSTFAGGQLAGAQSSGHRPVFVTGIADAAAIVPAAATAPAAAAEPLAPAAVGTVPSNKESAARSPSSAQREAGVLARYIPEYRA